MEKQNKILVAVGATAFVVGAVVTGAIMSSNSVSQADIDSQIDEAKLAAFAEGQDSVDITSDNEAVFQEGVDSVVAPEPVVEIKKVDNGNLAVVLETLYDNDGKVQYLLEDLEDDELDLIVERIAFTNDAKAMAVAEVKKEAIDALHKEMVGEVQLDEDDIERLKLYDDADEISLDDVDFEDLDADAFVSVRFEQDDVDYSAEFKVEIKDGKVDDMDLVSVSLRD